LEVPTKVSQGKNYEFQWVILDHQEEIKKEIIGTLR
jgi:hypothetical protein